jgi:uncharacterized protein YjdB
MQPLQVYATQEAAVETESAYDTSFTEGTGDNAFVSEKFLSGSAADNAYIPPADDPKAAIDALRAVYPEGMTFTDATHQYTSNGREYYSDGGYSTHSGSGCHAFAFILSDAAFGSMPIVIHSNFEDLKIGDAIRVSNDTHTVVVTDIKGDEVTIAQANYGGKVHWDEKISKSDPSDWGYIITRQKLDINSISEKHYFNGNTPVIYMGALKEGEDYTVEYVNKEDRYNCIATVTGINNFYGTRVLYYSNPSTKTAQSIGVSYIVGIDVGQTEELVVNGAKTPVTFRSSDDSIATVDSNGVVTGKNPGTVEITISAEEDNVYQAAETSVFITIYGESKRAQAISLSCSSSSIEEGQTAQLSVTGAHTSVSFRSSDESVATVSEAGVVTGLRAGTVEITATAAESSAYYSAMAQISITVTEDSVRAFVKRMYRVVLGREAEEVGLKKWTDDLKSGSSNAVDIVRGFFLSPEYTGKGKSNDEVITDCYSAMLDRLPDAGGFSDWKSKLESGMSVEAIFAGFVGSTEFGNLCERYGINPGTYTVTQERDKNAGVTMFVSRLYTKALGRSFDVNGLNDWCGQINANPSRANILSISTNGFFHSQEFLNKNLNNTEFVKTLYRTFLGREADDAGLADWVGQLDRGENTRDGVIGGFANSQEFSNIMAQYGL